MRMNKKEKIVPKLRFPKYESEWIIRNFDFEFLQTNNFSRAEMNDEKGSVKNIHYGDILTKYNDILRDISIVPFINENIDLSKFQEECYLKNGDIIIADTAEDLAAGKAIEILSIDFPILAGQHTFLCRSKIEFASRFLGYYLNSPSYHNKLVRLLTGIKVYSISKANIKKTLILYPEKYEEQQKIADCLSSVDELINAESRKLELLKKYKKGLMQKLFPSEGKASPEWRFSEFQRCDEWKAKSIEKSCIMFSGGTPDTVKREFYGGNIPFIRSAEIGKSSTELFITEEGLKNSSAKMVKKGDVLIALYGANSGEVALSRINGAINQAILCLRHETNNTFVYHYLTHIKNWIISKYIQGGQGNLSGQIIKAIELFFPQPEEQQKIADCLSKIDLLIMAQSNRVEKLKTHKKGLMQGLFPSLEEINV